jgi:GH15 family glucan-1,4-alpha-glucosidase
MPRGTVQVRDLDEAEGEPEPRIGTHGVVGDLHTTCLVGPDASVDWYCYPHFDDPPVFCRVLDAEQGGAFGFELADGRPHRQLYLPETNVLVTRLMSPAGQLEVADLMPIQAGAIRDEDEHWHGLIRRVRAIGGDLEVAVDCRPTFAYARHAPEVSLADGEVRFAGPERELRLTTPVPLEARQGPPGRAGARGSFELAEDEERWFTLAAPGEGDPCGRDPRSADALDELLDETVDYWRSWLRQCTYTGRWREEVHRSALTLKLLTFAPTGAIVAAPTASLPEAIGEDRNWDYRYTWLRDASFSLRALFRLGFVDEGRAFLNWLTDRIHEAPADEPIQALYGIEGERELTERTLDHLSGHRGSRPVRAGNGAHDQRQLDVFGEVLQTVFDYADRLGDLEATWQDLLPLMDWLVEHWREPDEGIWEVRGGRKHFVYSKVMAWVAFDRAVRLAEAYDLPGDVATWRAQREAVRGQVLDEGIDPERGCFTQHYGARELDAANLRIPLFGLLPPGDERVQATLAATKQALARDGLVRRYRPLATEDGFDSPEGTFSVCAFWLVDNLVLQGETEEAWLAFEKLLTYANHLGLFAEQVGPEGQPLGNFPQAFTHIGLIHSALALDKALTARRRTAGFDA